MDYEKALKDTDKGIAEANDRLYELRQKRQRESVLGDPLVQFLLVVVAILLISLIVCSVS